MAEIIKKLKEVLGRLKEIKKMLKRNERVGQEELEGYEDDELSPEDIIIKYKRKRSVESIDIQHDFTHIPTKEEIVDCFGPGQYYIYWRKEEGKRPTLKARYTIEGKPFIEVDHYEIKLRVKEGGKLLNTDATFPEKIPPDKDEIITELGGGGLIKLNAIDKDGKVLWSEWRDYLDIAPAKRYLIAEESTEGKLAEAIEKRKEKVENRIIEQIEGEEEGKTKKDGSKFETALDRITVVIEDKKMERLESAMEKFTESLSRPEGRSKEEGFTSLFFKKPYEMKLETEMDIIREIAKTDPKRAMEILEKRPDGMTILMRLMGAGATLTEAFGEWIRNQQKIGGEEKKEEQKVKFEERKEEPKVKVEEKESEEEYEIDFI